MYFLYLGNQCKQLMNRTPQLREVLPNNLTKYVDALDDFKKLSESSFGNDLKSDYQVAFKDFEESYRQLHIKSKSTKLHILMCHCKEICSTSGLGLGQNSEQAGEAMHARFSEHIRY